MPELVWRRLGRRAHAIPTGGWGWSLCGLCGLWLDADDETKRCTRCTDRTTEGETK